MAAAHAANRRNGQGRGGRRGGPSGGGGAGGSNEPGCLDQIKSGWDSLPLFNQYIIGICCSLYLISWLTEILNYYMVLIPVFMT